MDMPVIHAVLRAGYAALFITLTAGNAAAAQPVIPAPAAARAFADAHKLCSEDGGRLWGHSLCVPMMFVDASTHEAVLNQPAKNAKRDGGIYRTTLPRNAPIANTSVEYQGKRWSMVLWPLPKDPVHRAILLMHESYHSIQPALGLEGSGGLGKNGHLDTRNGRIWIRAELAALKHALIAKGEARKQAIKAALVFRAYRYSLFPQAQASERGLELNEGLAESTGIDVSQHTRSARLAAAEEDIKRVEHAPSFVRSFPYATGPAYAELLDAAKSGWRRHVTPTFAFANATAAAYDIRMPQADSKLAHKLIATYGGEQIIAQENLRAKRIALRNARFTKALIDGPTLTLPLKKFTISFDPRQVYSLTGHGSVYRTVQLGDAWGTLDVKGGMALISSGFDSVTIPVSGKPEGRIIKGNGWKLTLSRHSSIQPDKRHPGSYVLQSAVKP